MEIKHAFILDGLPYKLVDTLVQDVYPDNIFWFYAYCEYWDLRAKLATSYTVAIWHVKWKTNDTRSV